MTDFSNSVSNRFLRYTSFDTMSLSEEAGSRRPTSPGQLVMLEELLHELEAMGVECGLTPECVVHGILKENVQGVPAIAFMAHVDTSDAVIGNGVKAVRRVYTGGDIVLKNGTVIKASENPQLARYEGTEVITSDGSTLLGADDKAGVAEIMCALEHLVSHPEIKHGPVEVFFTPDEETGHGMDSFPYDRQVSRICYTVDGGGEGEIESECFNAASVKVRLHGRAAHLGCARAKLVNAIRTACQIASSIPATESPETTDNRQGYWHVDSVRGSVTEAEMEIVIRDFDSASFLQRIKHIEDLVRIHSDLSGAHFEVETEITYRNMKEVNDRHPEALELLEEACRKTGVKSVMNPIRGGTDGARMAQDADIPCINIFTGGYNFHSLEEWIPVCAMSCAVNLILALVEAAAERSRP